jgi:hypothetical protein
MNPSKDSKKANQYEKKYVPLPLGVQLRDAQTELNPAIDQEIAEKILALEELPDPTHAMPNDQITGRGKKLATSESQRKVAGDELKMKLEQEPPQLREEFEALADKLRNELCYQSGDPGEESTKARELMPSTAAQKMTGSSNQVPISAPNSVGQAPNLFFPAASLSGNPFQVDDIEFLVSGTPSDGPRTINVCSALGDILRRAALRWEEEATTAASCPWFGGSKTAHCANTRSFGANIANNTACLRCCYARIPCVLTLPNKPPVVLPLAVPMPGTTPHDTGYYISDGLKAWTRPG